MIYHLLIILISSSLLCFVYRASLKRIIFEEQQIRSSTMSSVQRRTGGLRSSTRKSGSSKKSDPGPRLRQISPHSSDALPSDPVDSCDNRSPILEALQGRYNIISSNVIPDSLTSPSLPPSSAPQPPQVWLTIQNSSMFLNTISPQSHKSDNSAVFDDNSNDNALDMKPQHHLVVADDEQGYTYHPVADAMVTTPHPSPYTPPCTRKYFTLCSLAEYISQINRTDPNVFKNPQTLEERLMYRDLFSYFPSVTRTVTMMLYFLYHAPQFYLPLAPFRHVISSVVDLAYACKQTHIKSTSSFDIICELVSGVLSNRIWHAVSCLYAHMKPYPGHSIPQVEHDKPPILEWLARDTLAAFNPIEIILMYYRPIMAEFNQISTPTLEDRLVYFRKVQDIGMWLGEMRPICIMYGLHIYDSQWVSMEAWKELAGYMNIISTKMAPDVFDVVQGKHPIPTNEEEEDDLLCAKYWYENFICCIAPCFTHHYRPMGDPHRYNVPFGNWPGSSYPQCQFTPAAFIDVTTNLPTALEQYATMYVEDPQQFECKGSQAVSLPLPSHYNSNGGHPHTIIPSSIGPAFREMISKARPSLEKDFYGDGPDCHRLTLDIPSYHLAFPQIQHLIRAIVKSPPVDDPVYTLFAPWFIHVTDHLRVMQPAPGSWVPPDPQFTNARRHHHNHHRQQGATSVPPQTIQRRETWI